MIVKKPKLIGSVSMPEIALTRLMTKCKTQIHLVLISELFLFLLRVKFVEIGRNLCSGYPDINVTMSKQAKLARKMSYTMRAKRYSRIDWLSKQNFCYEDKKSVKLLSIVTYGGLSFGFNMDENVFDKFT
jgi:hypothetical protein